MGGSGENRHTPALEHWSLAVKNGKALEKEWRSEIPIPRGGPHRKPSILSGIWELVLLMVLELLSLKMKINHSTSVGLEGSLLSCPECWLACIVVDDQLLVIGGQEGDFMAKPGSPIFKCSRRNEPSNKVEFRLGKLSADGGRKEVVFSDVYMLDDEMKWKNLPPMPKPDSHIEFAWVMVNHSIIIVGGTTEKHPITKKMVLVGEVFQFNLDSLKWSVIGKLPYRVKTTLAGFWNGWLYFTSGQRDKGPDDPAPKKVLGEMWRTKLSL
ncbi:Kelch repeat-containing protein [Vitis vinifera]|uniref:Kelch repeat-containing protein n=1 Tax=Vitis vinifera TaxID=29760 RepID=A0A438J418_VITVI|nr:Kelch repeat-containing protein [Vitis vinifera]